MIVWSITIFLLFNLFPGVWYVVRHTKKPVFNLIIYQAPGESIL